MSSGPSLASLASLASSGMSKLSGLRTGLIYTLGSLNALIPKSE